MCFEMVPQPWPTCRDPSCSNRLSSAKECLFTFSSISTHSKDWIEMFRSPVAKKCHMENIHVKLSVVRILDCRHMSIA